MSLAKYFYSLFFYVVHVHSKESKEKEHFWSISKRKLSKKWNLSAYLGRRMPLTVFILLYFPFPKPATKIAPICVEHYHTTSPLSDTPLRSLFSRSRTNVLLLPAPLSFISRFWCAGHKGWCFDCIMTWLGKPGVLVSPQLPIFLFLSIDLSSCLLLFLGLKVCVSSGAESLLLFHWIYKYSSIVHALREDLGLPQWRSSFSSSSSSA